MSGARPKGLSWDPFARIHAHRIRETKASELALRFGFGAAASLLAGIVSIVYGPRFGGLFLAFPAILPASLTLIEKKEGMDEASQDLIGAILGALGLVAFALVGGAALRHFHLVAALALAAGAWAACSVCAYALVEIIRRRFDRSKRASQA